MKLGGAAVAEKLKGVFASGVLVFGLGAAPKEKAAGFCVGNGFGGFKSLNGNLDIRSTLPATG